MINNEEINKIIKICNKYNFNLFMIGDYNINNKKSYQLKPATKKEFFNGLKLDVNNCFQLHLIKNHRQGTEINFCNLLKSFRGKSNEEIKNNILNNNDIKKQNYKDAIVSYNIKDKMLSSVHKFIDLINNDINLEGDKINIMYLTTTNKGAKNETAIINKTEYDPKKHKLGYAQTAHTAEGLTFLNKIYINLNNLFTDNILYVMLSRAKSISQIILIIEFFSWTFEN